MNTLILQTALIRAQQRGGLQKSAAPWLSPTDYMTGGLSAKVREKGQEWLGDVAGGFMVGKRPEGYAGGKSVGPRGARLFQPAEQEEGLNEPIAKDVFQAPLPQVGKVNPALGSVNWTTNPVQRAVQEAKAAYGNPAATAAEQFKKQFAPYLKWGGIALAGMGGLGLWSAYNQSQQTAALQQMAQRGGMNSQAYNDGYRQQQQPWAMSATRTPQEAE